MEQQEKTSGKVLFESLRKQFQKLVPQKLLRVLIVFGSILLTLGVIVGIVCGSLAIARCGTSHDPVTGEAVEAAVVQPAVPIPGLPNDTVVVKRPTEEPTAIPATLPPATQPPETPEPTPDPNEPTNYLEGRMLKKGDSDELIRNVQAILMELGYMDFDEPTDYFEIRRWKR